MQLAKDTLSESHSTETGSENTEIQLRLAEAESLAHDVKKLLIKSDEALSNIGVKTEVETIERWLESYRRGLSAANKISTSGAEIIQSLKARIKLAVDEIQRLEGEGGNITVTEEQQYRLEQLMKASGRFEKLIPQIEQMFQSCDISGETNKH